MHQSSLDPPSLFSLNLFFFGAFVGAVVLFVVRYGIRGFYTVGHNERAVKTIFGRAVRLEGRDTLQTPIASTLREDERARYAYPQLVVIPPGGPYFKMPWESIYKASVATMTVNMALDLEDRNANENGTRLEAVTKDQLNTGLSGQIRYRVMKNRDDSSYFHLAAAADDHAVKTLQSRDFFKHYTEKTRQVAGDEVTVTPIELIAETASS